MSQLTTFTGGSNGGSSCNLGLSSDAEGNPLISGGGATGFEQNTTAAVLHSNDSDACKVDLNIIKTVNKPVVKIGNTIVFSIIIKNEGPQPTTGVEVLDLLPAGLTYSAAASTVPINTTYTAVTGIWDLSALTIGVNQTLELQVAAIVNSINLKLNKIEIFKLDQTDKDSNPNSNN